MSLSLTSRASVSLRAARLTRPASRVSVRAMASFHDLSAKTITGEDLPFTSLKGKVVLITNVASACGYTASNYKVRLSRRVGSARGRWARGGVQA